MDYQSIAQLQISNCKYKIKARIARLWDSINHADNGLLMSFDAYLVDEQGSTILATIRPENAEYLKTVLDEKDIYYFSNFAVFPVRRTYRPCPNKYMIKFDRRIKIEKTVDANNEFPPDRFYFSNYSEMESRLGSKVYLTDMMGQIVKAFELSEIRSNQQMVKIRKIHFEDDMSNVISVTLWGDLAMKYDYQQISENSKKKPVIIICAAMMVTTFDRKTILSSTSASKIYFDMEIPEAEQLRRRIIQPKILEIIPSSGAKLSNLDDDMTKKRKTIAELLLLDKDTDAEKKFTCKARIKSVDVTDGWWYPTCPTCKKSTTQWEDKILCIECSLIEQTPILCYILHATVEDETGTALFTIFDRQAEKMIGISAATIMSMKDANRYVLPQIIADIFPKQHTFQVAINLNNKKVRTICFKVSKIMCDAMAGGDTSVKQIEDAHVLKTDAGNKIVEDSLSQETTQSNTRSKNRFDKPHSNLQLQTPQKSRSIQGDRRNKQILLHDSDTSISDDEPISAVIQKKKEPQK